MTKWTKFDTNEWHLTGNGVSAEISRERPQKFSLVHGYVNDNEKPWEWSAIVWVNGVRREIHIRDGSTVREAKAVVVAAIA